MSLLERVRHQLSGRNPVEQQMFGGISFMVDGRMLLAVREDRLLLRVDPQERPHLLEQGAQPACMGRDRPMGPSWITVDAALVEGARLDHWIGYADSWHAQQSPTG